MESENSNLSLYEKLQSASLIIGKARRVGASYTMSRNFYDSYLKSLRPKNRIESIKKILNG